MAPFSRYFSLICFLFFHSTTAPTARAFSPEDSPLVRAFFARPPQKSLLRNTQWKVRLDVGLQPGSWMPQRFPGWAESGARLGLDVEVQFTDIPSRSSERFVGPEGETFQLRVCSKSPSTFVSEQGQQNVTFVKGGYCIQRPTTGGIKNDDGTLMVQPEGLLRFWLDCPTGAKRRDVDINPGTRIFFSTGVWDDPTDVQMRRHEEYRQVLNELKSLETTMRKEVAKQQRNGNNNNLLDDLLDFSRKMGDLRRLDLLKERKAIYEMELPPKGSALGNNGVQIAPTGSLVIKGNGFLRDEYLILGKFSMKAVESDPTDFSRLGSIYFDEY